MIAPFVFGPGSAQNPAGGAYSAHPHPIAGLRGALPLRERGVKRKRGRDGKGAMIWSGPL